MRLAFGAAFGVRRHARRFGSAAARRRRSWQVSAPAWLPGLAAWPDLRRLALLEATREVPGKTSPDGRYYLSRLPVEVRRLSAAVRGH